MRWSLQSLQYSRETQHEKILRGLAVGIALTMYGRLEEADSLIEDLSKDKDPILRWSGELLRYERDKISIAEAPGLRA